MPSPGISKLALPPKPYRIDNRLDMFDQPVACGEENDTRFKLLYKYGDPKYEDDRLFPVSESITLADRLKSLPGSTAEASLACSLSMREARLRVGSWLWALHDDTVEHAPTTFTVASRSWEIEANQLRQFDPRKLVNEFLTDMNRAGGLNHIGYVTAFLHSELVNETLYRQHFHGLCTQEFAGILDKLRLNEKYQTRSGERPSIKIRRKPLDNVPYALTYLLKSYWPGIYEGPVGDGTFTGRQSHVRRIKEPHHSNVLLWLDQWRLEDITLLKNLRVRAGGLGFQPTKLYSHSSDGKAYNQSILPIRSSGMRF